eukprot:scaffold2531_cov130-Amphora_coffeaeformis.AAC.1
MNTLSTPNVIPGDMEGPNPAHFRNSRMSLLTEVIFYENNEATRLARESLAKLDLVIKAEGQCSLLSTNTTVNGIFAVDRDVALGSVTIGSVKRFFFPPVNSHHLYSIPVIKVIERYSDLVCGGKAPLYLRVLYLRGQTALQWLLSLSGNPKEFSQSPYHPRMVQSHSGCFTPANRRKGLFVGW